MNPGKIVRGTKMDDASLFRFRPDHRTLPLATALDWSAWDVHHDPAAGTFTPPGTGGDPARGFGKAVDMCNNNGHCRKFDAGTMCPSYRVTRDEQHLTRGRANTLRLALGGRIERGELAPGARLMSVRALALASGVSTMTVVNAYQRLVAEVNAVEVAEDDGALLPLRRGRPPVVEAGNHVAVRPRPAAGPARSPRRRSTSASCPSTAGP